MNLTNASSPINYDDASPLTREVVGEYPYVIIRDDCDMMYAQFATGKYCRPICIPLQSDFVNAAVFGDEGECFGFTDHLTTGQFHHLMAALGIKPKGSEAVIS